MVIGIITMSIIVIIMIFFLVLLSQIFERSPEKRVEAGANNFFQLLMIKGSE